MKSFFIICLFPIVFTSCISTYLEKVVSTDLNLPNYIGGSVVINDRNLEHLTIDGTCPQVDDFVILTEPIRTKLPCNNGKWIHQLNLNYINEGTNDVRVYDENNELIYSKTIVKNTDPEYLYFKKKERNLSSLADITYGPESMQGKAIAYTSDEFCARSNCNKLNIIIRLADENFSIPYYATRDTETNLYQPQMLLLSNGDYRIFFFEEDSDGSFYRVKYVDFETSTKTFTELKTLIDSTHKLSSLELHQDSNLKGYMVYLSERYCNENSCSGKKPVIRKSENNYTVAYDFKTADDCLVTGYKAYYQSSSENLHLLFRLSSGSTCSVSSGSEVSYEIFDGSNLNIQSTFYNKHFGGSSFIVKEDGSAHFFFRSTWDANCSTWAMYQQTSADNFASRTIIPGSCRTAISYPGDANSAKLALNSDGDILLFNFFYSNTTSPKHGIYLSKSSDNYASYTVIAQDDFSPFKRLALHINNNQYHLFSLKGSEGLLYFKTDYSFNMQSSEKITGPSSKNLNIVDMDNDIGIIGLDDGWCKNNSCTNNNYYLASIQDMDNKKWLTQVSQSGLNLSRPLYLKKASGEELFLYNANLDNSDAYNIYYKSSTDQFNTNQSIAAIGGNTSSFITDAVVDSSDELVISTIQGGNLVKQTSVDSFASGVTINSDSLGGRSIYLRINSNDDTFFTYGSNGSGWRGRARWSNDSFGADLFIIADSSIKYGGRDSTWSPSGDAEIYILTDNNADSRRDIAYYTSSDSFANVNTLLSFTEKSVCHSLNSSSAGSPHVVTKYGSDNLLYVLYSAVSDGSTSCQLYMKRSDDWNKTWKLSFDKLSSFEPISLTFRSGKLPIACAKTSFDLYCFDLDQVLRTQD